MNGADHPLSFPCHSSSVLSIDKAPDMVKLKEHLAECGPYWEDDGNEATAAEHQVYEKLAKINL